MNAPSFPFLPIATGALRRLQGSLTSKSQLESILTQLGWVARIDPTDVAVVADTLGIGPSLVTVAALADDLRYQRGDVLTLATELATVLGDLFETISALGNTSSSLGAPFNQAGFWPSIAQDLVPLLLATELQQSAPATYALLVVTGVVQQEQLLPMGAERLPYMRTSLHWQAIGDFLSDPVETLAARYGWGNDRVLDHQRVLHELVQLASLLSLTPRLSAAPAAIAYKYYSAAELKNQHISALILPFVSGMLPDNSGAIEMGLSLTPIPTTPLSGDAPAGFLLAPYLHGAVQQSIALRSDLILAFKGAFASDNAFGAEILPSTIRLESEPGTSALGAELSLIGAPSSAIRFFGTDTTSRVELTGYAMSIGMTGTIAQPELLLRIGTGLPSTGTGRLMVILEPGDGDNFIASAFGPNPIKLEVAGFITWSSRTGLGIDGAAGLHMRRTSNKTVGPLTFHDYTVDIAAQKEHPLAAAISLGASLKLGPVTASVEQIGVEFKLNNAPAGTKGVLDSLDVTWGFKAPTGVGIKVDSDLITGGGYLFLDPANHKYVGAANLIFKTTARNINLNALGILQTQLPGKPDAYSLLLLITATFEPIQLGLGFTLNGVGGLLGVNRAANTDFLRGLVRTGGLNQLLFPTNVLDNPADTLALVDTAFPATEGRYVIGLIAELGWGVPTNIITLDVALLIELPAPVRLVLLGVLQAVLPSHDNEILKLRADFLGSVDFGAKKAAFDASLSDSHILQFALTGDMAFRLYQGTNPLFLITAGGFHPAFQPPAGADLPSLRRLTLALCQGDELQITLASYFAVTSNTVQFGSHLDLYLRLRLGLHVEGHFGFDVLFQFDPFQVLAQVEASVAIKRGNSELLGLHLSLNVTGPGPWHIWGEASFRIWFVKISVGVDATLGAKKPLTKLAAPKVHDLLSAALQAPASWEVAAPNAGTPGGVVLRPVDSRAGTLFLDPRGSLVLRQRVVPLGLTIDKYGSGTAAPDGGQRFDISTLWVGDKSYAGSAVEAVTDFFAPDQFRRLSDAQKLSAPSFQLLPSGWRIKHLDGLQGAPTATRRVVQYEQLLLDGGRTGMASGGSTPAGIGQLSATAFQQLARNSAIGQAYQAAQPSARAPQPVGWAEDTYAVVNAADLSPYQGQDHFGSQVEAEQYRVAQPDAPELLVVPAYQLELA